MFIPKNDFAQSNYYDQMAPAVAGMLANASDYNLTDSAFVFGEPIPAGTGVVRQFTTANSNVQGVNNIAVRAPELTTKAEDFAGILVSNAVMHSDQSGAPAGRAGDVINYLRKDRVGGRVWVRLAKGAATPGANVHWIIAPVDGAVVGSFSAEEIAMTGVPTAGYLQGSAVNFAALKAVEKGALTLTVDTKEVSLQDLNFSTLNTLEDLVTLLSAELGEVEVSLHAANLKLVSKTTGADSKVSFAKSATIEGNVDVGGLLGLTEEAGALEFEGSASLTAATVALPNVKFLGNFEGGADALALVEIVTNV